MGDGPLYQAFGWNTVINLFYIPGCMLGGPFSDWIGPRHALAIGVMAQAIVGFGMAAGYEHLSQPGHVAGFAVVYGIFLSFGEFGPGDNIGLIASKTSATGIRGQYYGIAAAIGKIGAFVGTKVFPYISAAAGDDPIKAAQYPFWVSSSLCVLSAFLAIFCLPHIGQDTITKEDIRFRAYLESRGWDTRQMGLQKGEALSERSLELGEEKVVLAETSPSEKVKI
jgi:MFS family permease